MSWIAPPGAFDPEEIYDPNAQLAAEDTGFTGPDIETDQTVIAEQVFNALAARVSGWEAHDGNPDVWLIEAFAAVAAEIRTLAADVPAAIFATFGTEVLGLPTRIPTPALGISRWTAEDDRGYSIAPGIQITIARTGDELIGFEVISGATIEPGGTTVDEVELRAVIEGADGNGLSGPAEVSDPLDWVRSVEITQPTRNGDDGQTGTEYLDNLSNLLRIIAFRPVLPPDFAILALQVTEVGRAIAMDGYDPLTDTWGHPRTIAVVVTGPDGEPLSDVVRATVRDYLEGLREVNFIVNVISPRYEPTNVSFEVTAFAEQDIELVRDVCIDAVRQMLSPAQWRLGTTSPGIEAGEVIPPPGDGQPGRMTIRINDIVGLLDRCRGVDWVGLVEIDGEAADKVLEGPTTLPRPGAIEGTVLPG